MTIISTRSISNCRANINGWLNQLWFRLNPDNHHRLFCVITGAHQMELPAPLISWVNPFPSRVINSTIFFCNALESHECACCLLSFLYFHWLFPLLARETSSVNRSIYKSTRERVDSKGLGGRWRLHLMGSWSSLFKIQPFRQCSIFRVNLKSLGNLRSYDGNCNENATLKWTFCQV